MSNRVTQSDIARAAGVHNTTVSLALRNSPALLESTRARIRAIAEQLGYQPDPALQALVAYRNGRTPRRTRETIAFVTNGASKWAWQETPAHAQAYEGAKQKAAQAGFKLEHLWLGEPGMTPKRFCAMLFHRRITGVLIGAHRPDSDALLMMDWAPLSVVQLGFSDRAPAAHRVGSDHGAAMRIAFRRGVAAGYRRIGVVLPYWRDDAVGRAYSANFLAEQARLPEHERVPILLYGPGEYNEPTAAEGLGPAVDFPTFADWFGRHRPDLILSAEAFVKGQIDRLGLLVPADVAYADLSLQRPSGEIAGVRENAARVGEVAFELLNAQLHQNLCGLAPIPTTTLVEGRWSDGASLPAQKPPARPSRTDRGENPYRQDALLSVR